jgi:hypothetical protein
VSIEGKNAGNIPTNIAEICEWAYDNLTEKFFGRDCLSALLDDIGRISVRFHPKQEVDGPLGTARLGIIELYALYTDSLLKGVIIHELTHVITLFLSGELAFMPEKLGPVALRPEGSNQMRITYHPYYFYPKWFREGTSEYTALAIDNFRNKKNIFEIFGTDILSIGALTRGGFNVNPQKDPCYIQGSLIVEYITKVFGWEKVLELWKRGKNYESFLSAIKQILGIRVRDLDYDWRKWLFSRTTSDW